MVAITKDSLISGVIAKYMVMRHIGPQELAMAAMMTERTFRRKHKEPKKFAVGELRRVYDRLSVPQEERVGL